eukprot:scaffold11141_cov51-Phaeocystis_antarctica.AAC.2
MWRHAATIRPAGACIAAEVKGCSRLRGRRGRRWKRPRPREIEDRDAVAVPTPTADPVLELEVLYARGELDRVRECRKPVRGERGGVNRHAISQRLEEPHVALLATPPFVFPGWQTAGYSRGTRSYSCLSELNWTHQGKSQMSLAARAATAPKAAVRAARAAAERPVTARAAARATRATLVATAGRTCRCTGCTRSTSQCCCHPRRRGSSSRRSSLADAVSLCSMCSRRPSHMQSCETGRAPWRRPRTRSSWR